VYEETIFFESTLATASATYAVSSSVVEGQTMRNGTKETNSCSTSCYEQDQVRKEMIVGGTLGGFMFVMLVALGIGVLWAWRKRKRLLAEKGCEHFDMQDMGRAMVGIRREHELQTP